MVMKNNMSIYKEMVETSETHTDVIETSKLHALCQYFVDQEKWGELKNFMRTHQMAKHICQPYYDHF